jgi:hypothetical protein
MSRLNLFDHRPVESFTYVQARLGQANTNGNRDYSCAGICVSLSRHALNFRRRHTQHRPSEDAGEQGSPHTTQGFGFS